MTSAKFFLTYSFNSLIVGLAHNLCSTLLSALYVYCNVMCVYAASCHSIGINKVVRIELKPLGVFQSVQSSCVSLMHSKILPSNYSVSAAISSCGCGLSNWRIQIMNWERLHSKLCIAQRIVFHRYRAPSHRSGMKMMKCNPPPNSLKI